MSNSAIIKRMQDDLEQAHGSTSRPAGRAWVDMVLELARRILDAGSLADAITPEDLEQLQTDNYHTAAEAARVVLDLRGRA